METLLQMFLATCPHRSKDLFRGKHKCLSKLKTCNGECDYTKEFINELHKYQKVNE